MYTFQNFIPFESAILPPNSEGKVEIDTKIFIEAAGSLSALFRGLHSSILDSGCDNRAAQLQSLGETPSKTLSKKLLSIETTKLLIIIARDYRLNYYAMKELVETKNLEPSIAYRNSFNNHMKKFHSWTARQLIPQVLKLFPTRENFWNSVEVIQEGDEEKEKELQSVDDALIDWLDGLGKVLALLEAEFGL